MVGGPPVTRHRRTPLAGPAEWVAAAVATLAAAALVVMVGTGITDAPASPASTGPVVLEGWDDTVPGATHLDPGEGASIPLPGGESAGGAVGGSPGTITPVPHSNPGTYLPANGRCDIARLEALLADDGTAAAYARIVGVPEGSLRTWARSLEAATLGQDTRVTNHEVGDTEVLAYQAVLQAGTGVLTATDGTPVVRCASLTPLAPPRATASTYVGEGWVGFDPRDLIVIVADPVTIPLTPDAGVITASWPIKGATA